VDVCGKRNRINLINQVNFLIYFLRNPRYHQTRYTLLKDVTPKHISKKLGDGNTATEHSNSFVHHLEQLGKE
jgi:hypothetical protein